MLAYIFERFPTFTQTFCYREVCALRNQGVDLEIYSLRKRLDEPPQDYDPALIERVVFLPDATELHRLVNTAKGNGELPRKAVRALRAPPADKQRIYQAIWLGQRLTKAGVTHVHTHFAGLAARTVWWLRQLYGISYSFTGHANDIYCEEEHPVTLQDLIRDAAMVVTVSDFTLQQLTEKFPEASRRIHRVYNGLDLDRFRPSIMKRPLILSVGRYIEKKGFADLIRACAMLRDREIDYECRIVGEGPLQEGLQQQIQEANLEDRISLEGPKSLAAIVNLLGESRVFALPCVVEADGGMDNLPTVIVEAMAAALPVVSTRLAGVPEMVRHGETGYLVDPGDVEGLAANLERLLTDPEEARSLGQAGARHARSTFAVEITSRQLKHLLVEYGAFDPGPAALRKDPELRRPGWPQRLRRRLHW